MDILSYSFFQHALIGSLLASILCGIIGTYIVTRRLVFISGGITHASFGGIGIGVFLGINPILSAMVFSIMSACGVQWLSTKGNIREDSAIAMFWTLGMSIGIICSFLTPGFMPDLPSFLFGSILTIGVSDLLLLITRDQRKQGGPPCFPQGFTCLVVLWIQSHVCKVSITGLSPSSAELSNSILLPHLHLMTVLNPGAVARSGLASFPFARRY